MPNSCFTLSDLEQACPIITNGTKASDGILVDMSDILTKTLSSTKKNICEALALKAVVGTTGYKCHVPDAQNAFASVVEGKLMDNGFINSETITIFVPSVTATNAEAIDAYTQSGKRFMLLTKQIAHQGTESYIRIFGYEAGMLVTAIKEDSKDDIQGFTLTLSVTKNTKSAMFLYKTSETVTEAIWTALVTPYVAP